LSSRAPTALGMVLQCLGWWYNGGDGHTGPEVMGETRSTGPTSRRRPVRAQGRRLYPFRGFRHPLSRGAECRSYGSRRHSVMELTPAFPLQLPTGRDLSGPHITKGITFVGRVSLSALGVFDHFHVL
jgi:hypothetical protein